MERDPVERNSAETERQWKRVQSNVDRNHLLGWTITAILVVEGRLRPYLRMMSSHTIHPEV